MGEYIPPNTAHFELLVLRQPDERRYYVPTEPSLEDLQETLDYYENLGFPVLRIVFRAKNNRMLPWSC